jgi:hypothetical protein
MAKIIIIGFRRCRIKREEEKSDKTKTKEEVAREEGVTAEV